MGAEGPLLAFPYARTARTVPLGPLRERRDAVRIHTGQAQTRARHGPTQATMALAHMGAALGRGTPGADHLHARRAQVVASALTER